MLKLIRRNMNRFNNQNVLPFCYELIFKNLNNQQQQALSTSGDQNATTKDGAIENNPFYAKYADKINKAVANKAPITKQESKSEVSEAPKQTKSTESTDKPQVDNINKEAKTAFEDEKKKFGTNKRSLDDIVKLDMLKDLSKEEIEQIWSAYHSKKDCIYASIPSETYDTLFKNCQTYRSFILPLPRKSDSGTDGSYEFFLLQFQEHVCFFTPLAAYHLHKEIAPICFTMYHYPELSKTKGIVLMMGEFDSNILNIMECQCLANQLQYYYTTNDSAARMSLHLFNKEPKAFQHMRLIQHLEEGLLTDAITTFNLDKQD